MELNKDLYIDNVKDYLENGKNLWNYNATNTIVGVTSTYNNSTLTLNGTATGEASNISHTNMTYLKSGTYTFKIVKESGSATGSQAIIFKNYTTNTTILNTTLNLSTGNTYTFTLQNSAWVSLAIYFFASNVFTNLKLDIQIEEGSSTTPYEEYYGKYLNKGDGILIPYTLYENVNGYAGTITLSDDASNYRFLEIYFGGSTSTSDRIDYVKVDLSLSKNVSLFKFSSDAGGSLYAQCRDVTISGTTISTLDSTRYWSVSYTGSSWSKTATNSIYIRRVIGYR